MKVGANSEQMFPSCDQQQPSILYYALSKISHPPLPHSLVFTNK